MPRPHAVAADHSADPERDLRAAEDQVAAEEAQLHAELARLESAAGQLLARLQQARAAAAQAQLQGVRDPSFAEVHQRVHKTQVSLMDVSGERQTALRARQQALEARRRSSETIRQAVQGWASELSRVSSQLTADENALATWERQAREEADRRTKLERLQASPPLPQRPAAQTIPSAPAFAEGDAHRTQVARPQGRRGQPRVRMQAQVDLHSESNFFTGFSTNLSEGGLFVATVQAPPIGTEVDLSFTLGGERITVRGVVRWTREVNDNTPEIFPGVGIQFVGLDDTTAGAIASFVEAREPMFFPD